MPVSLKNIQLPKSRAYRSGSEYEPYAFFLEGLVNSTQFNFLLGYFSSSAINILALGFAKFIANGGNVRLIINQFLSTPDKEAILEGQRLKQEDVADKQIDFKNLATDLSDRGKHFFKCLAYLISKNRIEIICITPKEGNGISHFKSGIFSDGINQLYFKGSCNFTASGLISNLEELEVKESWDTDKDRAAINEYCNYFDNLFYKRADFVDYLSIKDTTETIIDCFGENDLDKLLKDEQNLIDKYLKDAVYGKRTKNILHALKDEIVKYQNSPKFPFPEGPRKYQTEAYDSWVANGYKGIFAMATGTGKTITALNCVLEVYKLNHIYQAIILVPTIALLSQWEKECIKFYFTQKIITVSSKCKWKNTLAEIEALRLLGKNPSFIIIATYASFNLNKFQFEFLKLPIETILIADEAHNLGAPSLLKKLSSIHLYKRIGLSATPERQYDLEVNKKISLFFNEYGKNHYAYEFNMWKAINESIDDKGNTALCRFRYYPYIVYLTDLEFEEYIEISIQIARLPEPRNKEQQEKFERLCIRRQNKIHKAENKIEVFKEIIRSELKRKGNLKYTLVYTPEGLSEEDDRFGRFLPFKADYIEENENDTKLIVNFSNAISEVGNEIGSTVSVRKFVGDVTASNRQELLKQFSVGNIEVLTSMKCLDEGVDIPRAEVAIFCASTGNPRQFVQRRGRILRKHPEKLEAKIYDLVVFPKVSGESEFNNYEKKEITKELKRIKDFAELSENYHYSLEKLKPILDYYNLTL